MKFYKRIGILKRAETSLRSLVMLRSGSWLLLIFLILFLFFGIVFWQYGQGAATFAAREFTRASTADVKMRISRGVGVARTMSMSVDNVFTNPGAKSDSAMAQNLFNFSSRLSQYNKETIYQAAYYRFVGQPQADAATGGGRLYLSTVDHPQPVQVAGGAQGMERLQQVLRQAEEERRVVVSDPYETHYAGASAAVKVISIAAPIEHNGKVMGSAGVDIPLELLSQLFAKLAMPDATVAYMVSSDGQLVAQSAPITDGRMSYLSENKGLYAAISEALANRSTELGVGVEVKESGMQSYILPLLVDPAAKPWVFVVSCPMSSYYAPIRIIMGILLVVMLVLMGFVLAMLSKLSLMFVKPVLDINERIKDLAKGHIFGSTAIESSRKDELGEIIGSINHLLDSQKQAANFAVAIGQGQFDTELELSLENDMANALISMKENLMESKLREEERSTQEQLTRWSNEGIAQFAELMRNVDDDLNSFSSRMLSSLVRYVDVIQGAFFVVDQERELLEMTACFAYNRQKFLQKEIAIGEGLVGRCYVEAEPIYLLDIPNEYIAITSGLGDTSPRALLLVPMMVDQVVVGVLELASLTAIPDHKQAFITKVGESIAATMRSVRINQQTQLLLSQTKQQAEEMSAAEEELRQNMEELQSTQEEMNRVQEKQSAVIERNNIDTQMFVALFHTTSEFVYFKDKNGFYVKVSDAACELLHVSNVEEAVGKTAYDLFPREVAQRIDEEDSLLLRSLKPIVREAGQLTSLNGEVVRVEKSKYPVTDDSGAAIGLIAIYKPLR